jgi:hypothetical protein
MADAAGSDVARLMIEAMAKHLPPSASRLRLLDVNGEAYPVLHSLRADLDALAVPGQVDLWPALEAGSVDAVLAYDYVLNEDFLAAALEALRPGGRLIVVRSRGQVSSAPGQRLEHCGYVRILVEQATAAGGVLIRGERAHTTADTLARVLRVAEDDAAQMTLDEYRGRYVHLLVQQTPNLPPWKRQPDEVIEWHAVAVRGPGQTGPVLLAFSSLPRAVSFMQPVVMAGMVRDINKVVKFSRQTVADWSLPLVINPDQSLLENVEVVLLPVDPGTAEAPDE